MLPLNKISSKLKFAVLLSAPIAFQANADSTALGWNIEQWKVTLPVSGDYYYQNGKSNAAELVPADCKNTETLTNNTSLPWFSREKVNGQSRLKFTVDLGGDVSTTPNTKYARSELRELYNFDSMDRCNNRVQNWSASGTHELKATLSIDKYPNKEVTGSDPKVIVGQIHGKDIKQALVKLQWDGEDKPVRVVLNDTFLPNNQLCDHCQPFSVNLGYAPANLDWDYTIRLNSKGIYLATTVSDETVERFIEWGVETEDRDGRKVTLSKEWLKEEHYFKAGLYAQIQPSKDFAGESFVVSFSDINIEHTYK